MLVLPPPQPPLMMISPPNVEDLDMKDWLIESVDPPSAAGGNLFELPKFAPSPLQHISHPCTHENNASADNLVANSASFITCNMFDIIPHVIDISLQSENPYSLSDIEIPDWLADEPSWTLTDDISHNSDFNPRLSSHEGIASLVDIQETPRMTYFDYPNLLVDGLLCAPMNQFNIQTVPPPTQATASSSSSVHHHHHQVTQTLSMPIIRASEAMDSSSLADKKDQGDCLKPPCLHSGPTSHGGWADVANVEVVQEVQVCRRLEEKRGNLSLEDTKRICLKVSKLQGLHQNSKSSNWKAHQNPESSIRRASENSNGKVHVDKKNCIINETFLQGWTCSRTLSNTVKGIADHHPRGTFEKSHEYSISGPRQEFSISEGLDDSFANKFCKKYPNYASCNHNLISADLSLEGHAPWSNSHFSTSLSPDLSDMLTCLSATDLLLDQQQEVTSEPEQEFVYGHPQSLEVHGPLGKDSSSQFLRVPHASPLPSLSWSTARGRCFPPPQMLKQEILAEKSRAHRFRLSNTLIPPSMSSTEKPVSINQSTEETGSTFMITKDLSNLHWSLAAAKTRAARKRRMGKCHVSNPSSSPLLAPAQRLSKSSSPALPNQESKLATRGFLRDTLIKPSIEKQILGSASTMRLLLQKELKPSDVGSLGRIILPKKDAEAKLPQLVAKEGLPLSMHDITTSQTWNLRYRFWPNNKSRMYLIENTRKFVEVHHLQEGDFIVLYMDDLTGKYLIQAKKVAQLVDKASTSCSGKLPDSSLMQERCKEQKCENTDVDGIDLREDVMGEDFTYLFRQPLSFTLGLDMNGLDHMAHIEDDMTIEQMFDLEDSVTMCQMATTVI